MKGELITVLKGEKVIPKDLKYHGGNFRKAQINPLQIGKALYLELETPYLYFNHSCNPNSGIRGEATLYAIKNINKGEEITFDYSTTMDESFRCKCGAKICRKIIVDFLALPQRTQQYYARKKALPRFILSQIITPQRKN